MSVIELRGLTREYRGTTALDDVTASVRENTITGLLGRNGSGKSTLLRILAGLEFPSSGTVQVFGQVPTENEAVLRRTALVRENRPIPDLQFWRVLEVASWVYPNWDADYAARLTEDFGLPLKRAMKKFSRGMQSAAGIVLGLASRAELTILDEPYAGLDAAARQLFYDRLLADYSEHPRTVLLSTHLIDEIGDLLEDVIVLDRGRVLMAGPADEIRGGAFVVSGPIAAAADLVAGRPVLRREELGGRARITVRDRLTERDREVAAAGGLALEPVSLQQLVVSTASTAPTTGGVR